MMMYKTLLGCIFLSIALGIIVGIDLFYFIPDIKDAWRLGDYRFRYASPLIFGMIVLDFCILWLTHCIWLFTEYRIERRRRLKQSNKFKSFLVVFIGTPMSPIGRAEKIVKPLSNFLRGAVISGDGGAWNNSKEIGCYVDIQTDEVEQTIEIVKRFLIAENAPPNSTVTQFKPRIVHSVYDAKDTPSNATEEIQYIGSSTIGYDLRYRKMHD